MKKQIKLFNGSFEYTLTDLPGVKFLDGQEEIDMQVDTQENEGTDGVILGSTTFGPFNLILNISYKGNDAEDVRLIKQKLRSLLFRREPYYIWHSDTPQKKYAVYCETLDSEDLTNSFSTFKITFVVYKGFSESLKSTKDINFLLEDIHLSEDRSAEDYEYDFNRSRFVIYNAGDVTVDPREHYLNIKIEGESDGEITVVNKTTKDRFIYYPEISSITGEWIDLKGVYPKKNGINCGIDTNHGLISLVPGINEIEIQNVSRVKTSWDFYFLYK